MWVRLDNRYTAGSMAIVSTSRTGKRRNLLRWNTLTAKDTLLLDQAPGDLISFGNKPQDGFLVKFAL